MPVVVVRDSGGEDCWIVWSHEERMTAPGRIERSEGHRLFGLNPAGYDAARPRYPAALFDAMRAAGVFARGRSTLEIGAGSGLATKPLLELGADPLTLVEP